MVYSSVNRSIEGGVGKRAARGGPVAYILVAPILRHHRMYATGPGAARLPTLKFEGNGKIPCPDQVEGLTLEHYPCDPR